MLFTKSTFFFDTDYEKEDSWTFFGVNYQSFGAPMTGRTFSSEKYRFGFNGQEKSDEISGAGNHTTAQFWEYDPRLGRRWNLDPVPYPWQSSYSAFNNNPIIL
jgi:hypothetical protein